MSRKRLLLINTRIEDYSTLVKSALENGAVVFTYDNNVSVDKFLADLHAHEQVQLDSFDEVGWIFHGFTQGKLCLFNDVEIQVKDILSVKPELSPDAAKLLSSLGKLQVSRMGHVPRIDLLACCLAQDPETFNRFSSMVRKAAGVDLAASANLTGNVSGADWVLETHNIDSANIYFNAESLRDYNFAFIKDQDNYNLGLAIIAKCAQINEFIATREGQLNQYKNAPQFIFVEFTNNAYANAIANAESRLNRYKSDTQVIFDEFTNSVYANATLCFAAYTALLGRASAIYEILNPPRDSVDSGGR